MTRKQTWINNRCNQDVFSQKELIIHPVGDIALVSPAVLVIGGGVVVKYLRLCLVHEEGAADRLAVLAVLVHSIVDVLNETIAQLDVLAAYTWYGLVVAERLLERLGVVVVVIAEPRKECSHDGPTYKQLGINDLALVCSTESTNITARYRLSRKTNTQDKGNVHLHEFPIRSAVTSPQASEAVDANKATSSDDKMAPVWSEAFQSLVGSFA